MPPLGEGLSGHPEDMRSKGQVELVTHSVAPGSFPTTKMMWASGYQADAGEGGREGYRDGRPLEPGIRHSTSHVTEATGTASLPQRGFLGWATNQVSSFLHLSTLRGGAPKLTCLGL